MKTRIQDPLAAFRTLWTNPSTTVGVSAGTPVRTSDGTVYVAVEDIAPGQEGLVERGGVYQFPAATGLTLDRGVMVDWDGSAVVAGGTGLFEIGRVRRAKTTDQTAVNVGVDLPPGIVGGERTITSAQATARSVPLGTVPDAIAGRVVHATVRAANGAQVTGPFDVDVTPQSGTGTSLLTLTWPSSGVTVAANDRIGWFILA